MSEAGPLSQENTPSGAGSRFDVQLKDASPRAVQFDGDDKDAAPAGAGKSSGLKNYEATLGKWLGGELYKAVSGEITLDKLSGHAESAIKSALGPLADLMKDHASADVDPAEVDKAVAALKSTLGKEAKKFVQANGAGFARSLQGFVDANPELIVLLALLAAAGAVAANMKIPELKAKLGVAEGLTAQVAVKLGRIQDITLERIEGQLKYAAGGLKATAVVGWEEEDGMDARLDLRYGLRDGLDLTGRASWDEKDGYGARLGLDYKPNDRLSIGAHVGYDEDKGANAGVGVPLRV